MIRCCGWGKGRLSWQARKMVKNMLQVMTQRRTQNINRMLSIIIQVDILSRYVKFLHSLIKSASPEVQVLSRYLARDVQSVTGRNLRLVQETANLDPWTNSTNNLRRALISSEMVEVPIMDRWRLPYLRSLISQRREANSLAMEAEETRLEELIESLVFNQTSLLFEQVPEGPNTNSPPRSLFIYLVANIILLRIKLYI